MSFCTISLGTVLGSVFEIYLGIRNLVELKVLRLSRVTFILKWLKKVRVSISFLWHCLLLSQGQEGNRTFPLAIPLTALTIVFLASLSGTAPVRFFALSVASFSLVLCVLYLSISARNLHQKPTSSQRGPWRPSCRLPVRREVLASFVASGQTPVRYHPHS